MLTIKLTVNRSPLRWASFATAVGLCLSVAAGPSAHATRIDDAELTCLTEAIYFEAGVEGYQGRLAVAEVILNRRDDARFPNHICDVVRQGYIPGRYACQFSYYCDGRPETVENPKQFEEIRDLARYAIQRPWRNLTHGATHYHADYVNPDWAREMHQITQVETHIFYRRP